MSNRTTDNLSMTQNKTSNSKQDKAKCASASQTDQQKYPKELGGRKQGLEPTRYGDWEKNGRCIDF